MSEMIERVARAIDEASQPPGRPDYKILMENCARAAIEAMREPTAEMLLLEEHGATKETYQKWIDAALGKVDA